MQRRLKFKLLLVQFATIVPFLIFIFYLFDLWYDARRSMVLEQNITQAKLVASTVRDSIKTGSRLTTELSSNIIFQRFVSTDKKTASYILNNILTNLPELDTIRVIDTKGQIIVSSPELSEEEEKITISDRDYFQEAISSKKTTISNPLIGRLSGKKIITVVTPILEENNITGLVGVSIDLEKLKDKLEKILGGNSQRIVVLLDKDGQIAFTLHKPFPSNSEKTLLSDFSFVKTAQEGKLALIEAQRTPLTNELVIGAASPVAELGWVVVSIEPMENVFSPLFKLQSAVWLIIFVGLLFSLSIITYFLRKVRIVY